LILAPEKSEGPAISWNLLTRQLLFCPLSLGWQRAIHWCQPNAMVIGRSLLTCFSQPTFIFIPMYVGMHAICYLCLLFS
jgi:hypothetical protein